MLKIISYRNDFSAHSSNRGRGESEHSFILDRHAMKQGKLKGYTANHQTGCVFKDANINELIESWDTALEEQLKIVSRKVLISKT